MQFRSMTTLAKTRAVPNRNIRSGLSEATKMSESQELPPCPPEYTPEEWAEYHRDPCGWCIKELRHPDPSVRYNAADVLRGMAADAVLAIPALATGCADPDHQVRAQCVFALLDIAQNVGHEAAAAVPALIGALSDSVLEIRRLAVKALGRIEDSAAIPPLRGLLTDPDAKMREAAAAALARISPQ
jgi:HEAT repeat protein